MKTYKSIVWILVAALLCTLNSCVKEMETTVGSIQGIVTNSTNNEPIQGVNISLSPTGLSAVTGSDGRYEFTILTAGQYTVQGVKSGFESNTKNITIVAGNISSGDMTLKPEIAGFKLNVEYLDYGTSFSHLNFKVINTSTSLPLDWSITESIAWLTAVPSSGHLNAGEEIMVLVSIDRDQIEQSTTANLTVEGADQTIVLPINVSVSGSQGPQLQLSETSLDFGTSATSLAFYVMNTGPAGTSLNWACSNINVDWLTVTPTSGNTDGGGSTAVMATIDRSKIDGMVSTSITISGAGSSSSISISASSEGAGAAILQLSEGSLDFGENETTKTFQVKNVGSTGTVLDWAIASTSVDWLSFSPMTGNTNAGSGTTVTAIVDRNKFNGLVSTTVTVNGNNNSANISVSAANVHAAMEVSTTSVDFGTTESTKTITIKNVGDEGSTLQWSIATPSVNWLTASPMSGNIGYNQTSSVTLTIDRNAFVGNLTTDIRITGANTTETVTISADNSVIVTDGLMAYYTFDEGTITDWGNSFNPGMNFGALTSTDTPNGEGLSLQFDGETSYVSIPDNIIPGGVPWSFNIWIKTNRNTVTFFGTDVRYYHFGIAGNGSLAIYTGSYSSIQYYWMTANPITAYLNNQWHMLTFTYNGTTCIWYIDGVLFETVQKNAMYWTSTGINTTYFGKHGAGYGNCGNLMPFNGKMDNIRTYSRALTQDEVRALYNAKQ